MPGPILIIHGGATVRADFPHLPKTAASVDRIVRAAAASLSQGASALSAAARAVELLEADPLFNAGYGSKLQADGIPRLSASVMDGTRGRFGAVINVQDLCHPSQLALHLLDADDRVLDGHGAHQLASELRLPRRSPMTDERFQQWLRGQETDPHGTVGAVALDADGRLAAFTSTGGKGNERVGRVSDSATPAGNYANARIAISCTGIGEHILEAAVAPRLAAWVEAGQPLSEAAATMERELRASERQLGFIAVDSLGTVAAHFTTPCMVYRVWREGVVDGWPQHG